MRDLAHVAQGGDAVWDGNGWLYGTICGRIVPLWELDTPGTRLPPCRRCDVVLELRRQLPPVPPQLDGQSNLF
jgi:hypothetical protein